MKRIRLFINCSIVILLLLWSAFSLASSAITDYHQTFSPVYSSQGHLYIAIRYFERDNKHYFLIVDPYTLKTSVKLVEKLYFHNPVDTFNYPNWETIKNTPYIKSLWQFTSPKYQLQNYGLTHATHQVNGFFLTIDMCPSIKPFEKKFFMELVNLSYAQKKPIPIAISISGSWLLTHPKEWEWLLSHQKTKKLDITWINHSFTHLYFKDRPLQGNFLLFSQTNVENEILTTEKLLLEHNQLPSVFFRFPGLISDKNLILKLRHLGLIPVGSDACLAKEEIPKPGSIILVHGNGNEHEGIDKIMPYLKQNVQWLELTESVTNKSD